MKKVKIPMNKYHIKFIPTNSRRFIQIELDYAENTKLFNSKLPDLIPDVSNAIVYINIRVKHEDLSRLNIEAIKQYCEDAFILRPITPIIVKESKIRNKNIIHNDSIEDSAEEFLKAHNPKGKESILEKFLSIVRGGNNED